MSAPTTSATVTVGSRWISRRQKHVRHPEYVYEVLAVSGTGTEPGDETVNFRLLPLIAINEQFENTVPAAVFEAQFVLVPEGHVSPMQVLA